MRTFRRALIFALSVSGCTEADGSGSDGNEAELITTVTLTFAPDAGGDPVTASFRDPDGDGGMSGTSDPIVLTADTNYGLSVAFLNDLRDPAEDITAEVREEADEHQVLIYGDAVEGPATSTTGAPITHAYADMDSGGLPLGLEHTISAHAAGTGELRVMLRHLPPVNDAATKVAGLAEQLADGQALPGEPDADVGFELTVQ